MLSYLVKLRAARLSCETQFKSSRVHDKGISIPIFYNAIYISRHHLTALPLMCQGMDGD